MRLGDEERGGIDAPEPGKDNLETSAYSCDGGKCAPRIGRREQTCLRGRPRSEVGNPDVADGFPEFYQCLQHPICHPIARRVRSVVAGGMKVYDEARLFPVDRGTITEGFPEGVEHMFRA